MIAPGICAGIGSYRRLAEGVADLANVEVTILEMPGSGSPVEMGVSLEQLTAGAVEALNTLELANHVVLLGHSRGGSVALAMATMLPAKRVAGVIGINPKTHVLKTDLSVVLPGLKSMGGVDLMTTGYLAMDLFRSAAPEDLRHHLWDLRRNWPGLRDRLPAFLHTDELHDIDHFLDTNRKKLSDRTRERLRLNMASSLIDMISVTGTIDLTHLPRYVRAQKLPLQFHLGKKDSITPWAENVKFAEDAGGSHIEYGGVGHLLGSITPDSLVKNVASCVEVMLDRERVVDARGSIPVFAEGGNTFQSGIGIEIG